MLKRLRPGNGETIEVKVKGSRPADPLAPQLARAPVQPAGERSAPRRDPHHAGLFELRRGRRISVASSRLAERARRRTLGARAVHPWRDRAVARLCPSAPFRWLGAAARRGVDRGGGRHEARACLAARRATADPQAAAPRGRWRTRACAAAAARLAEASGASGSARAGRRACEPARPQPARIFVRDQTTRWGSCSTTGALSFSWRLVLAPPFVLDYLAAHEVAHLGHMNHGPRFWGLVERTMPRHDEARSWLRKHGASLHRYGCGRHAALLERTLAQAQHRVALRD